jgi:hypothetical protein
MVWLSPIIATLARNRPKMNSTGMIKNEIAVRELKSRSAILEIAMEITQEPGGSEGGRHAGP